ncbi:MAG TPA: hypothetical protein VND94_12635 [Terriglobia bacterium]|nr:hypothetical protein [Terriglobia bacterium]
MMRIPDLEDGPTEPAGGASKTIPPTAPGYADSQGTVIFAELMAVSALRKATRSGARTGLTGSGADPAVSVMAVTGRGR